MLLTPRMESYLFSIPKYHAPKHLGSPSPNFASGTFLSLLQSPPRDVFAVLHAFEMYALHALVSFGNSFFKRRCCGC
jgi:hypothetical protein